MKSEHANGREHGEEPATLRAHVGGLEQMILQLRAERDAAVAHAQAMTLSAKESRRHLVFLAAAGAVLAHSLEAEATLQHLTQLVVPHLGDWCAIVLAGEHGLQQRQFVSHVAPERTAVVQAQLAMQQLPPDAQQLLARVALTGDAEILLSLNLDSSEAGLQTLMAAPLLHREQVLGVIAVAREQGQQAYRPPDLALLKEIARRAAVTLEQTRLYCETQEAVRHKEGALALVDTLLATLPVGVGLLDHTLRCLHLNQALAGLGNTTIAAALGRPISEVVPVIAEHILPALQRVVQTGETLVAHDVTEELGGEIRQWLASCYPVAAPPHTQVVVVIEDVTERRRLEEQLLQTQRLESIGLVAGGIAHDFNNLLAVIAGYNSLAREELAEQQPEHPALASLDKQQLACDRASALIKQLLAFARKQRLIPRLLDMGDLLRVLEPLLRQIVGDSIACVLVLPAEPCMVRADASQLEQVLMNMAVNARDAMPGGGTLIIEAQALPGDEVNVPLLKPGPYLLLSVSDTGIGMDEATQRRIFEPFYSTKPGRGSGLGLATCFGIIRQHGGAIEVASEPHGGTTFSIYLPIEVASSAQPGELHPGSEPFVGVETILLVEPDHSLRVTAAQTLRQQGYAVLEAADTQEALGLVGAQPAAIDLVVIDQRLLTEPGPELLERLSDQSSALRVVLIIEGHAAAPAGFHELGWRAALLPRPFSPLVLARLVRATLDQP